jgi:hypothetical protein
LSTLKVLFQRRLGDHEAFLGMAEDMAQLNCLIEQGRVSRSVGEDGVWLYTRCDRDAAAAA